MRDVERRQIARLDLLPVGEDGGALDHVLQLADVARPAVGVEAQQRRRRHARRPRPGAAPPRQEVGDQLGDVLLALAQRRQLDRHDGEAVVEILAELPVADELAQVLVGRRQDAHVDLDEHVAADRLDLALLDHAQELVLHLGRDVADLVEEERAARAPRGTGRAAPAARR